MAKRNIIAGLDVGSGKLTAVAAEFDAGTNSLQVVAGNSIPCKGVRGGVVTDIRETSAAVSRLLGGLEQDLDRDISRLYVGVRGSHLDSFTSHGSYNISRMDNEITQDDMNLAIENAKSGSIKSDKEFVNVVTQGFSVDGVRGFPNPEGMEGSLLEVDVHITIGSSSHLNNLAKAIQRPGYKIDKMIYGFVPLSYCAVSAEEKTNGAMVIDFGGETMSVGIYIEGMLRFSRDIPYGCDLITSDLSRLLHTSRQNAKEIKEKYGVSFATYLDAEEEIQVPSLDGRHTETIKKSYLLDLIQPRVEELFEQIQHYVSNSGYKQTHLAGILTGGGSLMPGMTNHAMNILGLKDVRLGGVQREMVIAPDEFMDPAYSTALALLVYSQQQDDYAEESYRQGSVSKVGRFFKDLFGN